MADATEAGASSLGLTHRDIGVSFESTGVRLYFGAGESKHGSNELRLIYSLKVPREPRGKLTLSTGEDVREMPITLAVTMKAPEGDWVGAFYYSERYSDVGYGHPAHLSAEVSVPKEQFDALHALARAGHYPSIIGMQVAGLKFGALYDGADVVWDTKDTNQQVRTISHIDFSYALAGAAIDEAAEESGIKREKTISAEAIEKLQTQMSVMARRLGWILAVLIAACILILLR